MHRFHFARDIQSAHSEKIASGTSLRGNSERFTSAFAVQLFSFIAAVVSLILCLSSPAFAATSVSYTDTEFSGAKLGKVFVNPSSFSYSNAQISLPNANWTIWEEKNGSSAVGDDYGQYGMYIGRKGVSSGQTLNEPITITWRNVGYDIYGNSVGVKLTINSMYIASFRSDKEDKYWGTNAGWEGFLYWWRDDGLPYFASFTTAHSKNFTVQAIDASGNPINMPMQWVFTDIDQDQDNTSWCTDITDAWNTYPYAEGIIARSGITESFLSTPTCINQDIVNRSGGTRFFGTRHTNGIEERKSSVVFYAPNGSFTAEWRGADCATGVMGNFSAGRIPELEKPTKSTSSDIVFEGDMITYNIDERFPVVPDDNKAYSISFSDTLDAALNPVSLKVYRGSTDVTGNWNISISGQSVTASAKNTGHSSSAAQGQHRFVVSAKVRNGIDYTRLSKSGDYYIIPNKASVMLKPTSSSTLTQETNTVNVRIKGSAISIQKRADSFEYLPDGTITYKLTISNIEPNSRASNVRVSDSSLPSSFKVNGIDISSPISVATHQILGSGFSAIIPSIDYGRPAIITVRATAGNAANGRVFLNTASATSSNPKPGAVQTVQDSDHVWINRAKIDLSKTPDKREVHVGDVVRYTVHMRNVNAGTVGRNIVLVDELPDVMELDKSSITVNGVPATVSMPIDGNHRDETYQTFDNSHVLDANALGNGFSLSIPLLDDSADVIVEYTAMAKAEGNGMTVYNHAHVTGSNVEQPSPDIEEKVLINSPEVDIEKSADAFEYAPGEIVTYTVHVRQTVEGGIAKQVVVRDDLPPSVMLLPDSVEISCPDGQIPVVECRPVHEITRSAGIPYEQAGVAVRDNILQVTIPYLGSGEDMIITYKARANDDSAGKRPVNTASVTFSNPHPDSSIDYPKRASDDVWINDARMKVSKSADKYEYRVGETAHFTLGLHNDIDTEGTVARNVVLTDEQLPQDFKIDLSSIEVTGVPDPIHYPVDGSGTPRSETRSNNWKVVPNENGNGFVLSIPYFPDSASVTVTYDAVAVKEINGLDALNHARVEDDNPNDPGDETETHIWTNDAELKLVKGTDEFEHRVGDIVEYRLSLSNIAAGTIAKNVIVSDISLPDGARLVDGSISVSGVPETVDYKVSADDNASSQSIEVRSNPVEISYQGNGFKISIPYLPSDDVATVSYKVAMEEAVNGEVVRNTASATCDNLVPDQDPEDLNDNEIVYVNTPHLDIRKDTSTPEIHVGQTVEYTITLQNTAHGTIAGSPVTVTDEMPEGIELIDGSIDVSGVPATIEYPVKDAEKAGTLTETRQNGYSVEVSEDKRSFTIDFDYVPGSVEIIIRYNARATEMANGKHLTNKVCAVSPNNPDEESSDETMVFVNSPKLEISKRAKGHEYNIGDEIAYTIDIDSVAEGTVARCVHVEDILPDHFELVEGSVHILAMPDSSSSPSITEKPDGKQGFSIDIDEMGYGRASIIYKVRTCAGSEGVRYVNHVRMSFENIPPSDENEYPKEGIDDIWVNDAKTNTTKSADKFEYEIGETAHFIIGLSNVSANGTIAKNVVLTDTQLPEDFKIDMNSIRITGVPESVSYPIDGNGILTEEERANTWEILPHENGAGFDLHLQYLPQGSLITIEYDAVANREINGLDALNKVSARSDNPNDPGSTSEVHVWTNTADLALSKSVDRYEHQIGDEIAYMLSVSNVAAGTVGKNVYVADVSLPEYLELVSDSIEVVGVPEKVLYPEQGENGERIEFECDNSYSVILEGSDEFDHATAEASYSNHDYSYSLSGTGNGFIVKCDYLPAGVPVEIRYKVIAKDEANGHEIENFASADCDNSDKTGSAGAPSDPDVPENPDSPIDPEKPGTGGDGINNTAGPVHDTALVSINTPSLSILKTSDKHFIRTGDSAHYTLRVQNNASGTIARNVSIVDTLTPYRNIEYKNVTAYGVIGEGDDAVTEKIGDISVNRLSDNSIEIWTGENLTSAGHLVEVRNRMESESDRANAAASDKYNEIVVEYDITATQNMLSGRFDNIAEAHADNSEPVRDNESVDIASVKQGYQLTVYKQSAPALGALVVSEDEITYTLIAKNTGKDVVPFVHLRDYIPDGVVFESAGDAGTYVASNAAHSADAAGLDIDGHISSDSGNGYVEWVLDDIAPNEEKSVSYKVRVIDDTAIDDTESNAVALPLYIRNVALYEAVDANPGNPGEIPYERVPSHESNEVIHSTDPDYPAPAVLDGEKSSDPVPGTIVHNGEAIRYSIAIRNNGGSAARNIIVRDYIDAHLSVVPESVSDNGNDDDIHGRIDWMIDEILPGEEKIVTFETTVCDTMPLDVIANQALFENEWDASLDRDPENSTNIVEHASDGDAMVADELIISDTGTTFALIITAVTAAAAVAVLSVLFVLRRIRESSRS